MFERRARSKDNTAAFETTTTMPFILFSNQRLQSKVRMEQNDPIPEQYGNTATRSLPLPATLQSAERWLQIIRSTRDPDEALEFAQRAVDLQPDNPRVHASLLRIVGEQLKRDPFVAFLAETDKHYVITFRNSRPIVVPKARTNRELFPPIQRTEGERVLGMVWWVVLGLVPAGIGAIILSPWVVRRALRVINDRQAEPRDQRLAWLALFLAAGLVQLGVNPSVVVSERKIRGHTRQLNLAVA